MSDNPGDWWDWDWGGEGGEGGSSGGSGGDWYDPLTSGVGTLIGYGLLYVVLPVVVFFSILNAIFGASRLAVTGSPGAAATSRQSVIREGKEAVDLLEELAPGVEGGGSGTAVGPNYDGTAEYCARLARQAYSAFGPRWPEHISFSDAARCGLQPAPQPRFAQPPRPQGDYPSPNDYYPAPPRAEAPYDGNSSNATDCWRLIERARNRLGSRWRQEVDHNRCAREIAIERQRSPQ